MSDTRPHVYVSGREEGIVAAGWDDRGSRGKPERDEPRVGLGDERASRQLGHRSLPLASSSLRISFIAPTARCCRTLSTVASCQQRTKLRRVARFPPFALFCPDAACLAAQTPLARPRTPGGARNRGKRILLRFSFPFGFSFSPSSPPQAPPCHHSIIIFYSSPRVA